MGNTMSQTPFRERALQMLQNYLDTTVGLRPMFVLPRSETVDRLLCRWAFWGEEVSNALYAAMLDLHQNPADPQRNGRADHWALAAAARVHAQQGLGARLNAYMQLVWETSQLPTTTGDDSTVPAHVAPGARVRPRIDTSARLQSLVRSWSPGRAGLELDTGAALQLDAAGPLLSDVEPAKGLPYRQIRGRTYFEERLGAELRRADRDRVPLSVVVLEVLDVVEHERSAPIRGHDAEEAIRHQVRELVGGSLRAYDLLSQDPEGNLLLLLPGASAWACAAVVARVRQKLAPEDGACVRIAVGTATHPDDGSDPRALRERAAWAWELDRLRQLNGRLEMDSVPPWMVERIARQEPETTIWFQDLSPRMPVQVLRTAEGVRLKLALSFLRRGGPFRLDLERAGPHSGRVRGALLSKYRSADDCPVVYLDISTD
jgi:GGDEF domain-containing protein